MSVETLVPFDEALTRYEPVLGLETHVELGTVTKMFCGCSTIFGAPPNTQVCPVCLGLPGSLPVPNRAAIEGTSRSGWRSTARSSSGAGSRGRTTSIRTCPRTTRSPSTTSRSAFDGYLDVEVEGRTVRVEIERVHMEEDTGKSLHVGGTTGRIHGADYSLVDYNRAGIPLVEIVTKPSPAPAQMAPAVAQGLRRRAARPAAGARRVRCTDGARAPCAATSTSR